MATITAVSLDHINSAFGTTVKSPVDIANNIKSYASSNGDTLDTAQMLVSALGTLETFASAVARYKTSIPGVGLTLTSLELNRQQALEDIETFGQIQNSTLNSIFADVSSLTTNVGLATKNPYVIGLGLTASVGFSTAALLSTEGDTSMANGIVEFASDTYNTYNQVTDSLSDSKTEFLDTVDYLYSASGLVQDQYQDYKDIMSDTSSSNLEFPTLSSWLKDNNTAIKIDSDDIVQYLDTIGVEKVKLDNQTYTIQNGDTLSQIAQTNNTTVDKIIEDNPWLTEENRISTDGSYALIKSGEKTIINFDEDSSNPDKIIYVEISKYYYKVKESNNENLLLNTLFLPISSLSQKKYSSFSLLNSNILFSQSLELEKNRVSNNRFSGRDIA